MAGGIRGPVVIGGGSGGGFQTAHTETAIGDPVNIGAAANALLPIGDISIEQDGTIIEISDPTHPTVIEAGIYSITAEVDYAGGTAVGYAVYSFNMDYNNNQWNSSPTVVLGTDPSAVSISLTTYMPAGGVFLLRVINNGDAAGDFNYGYCEIQRIT